MLRNLMRAARLTAAPSVPANLADTDIKAPPFPGYPYQGYIDELSPRHVAGWIRNLHNAAERVRFEVASQNAVLATGQADLYRPGLAEIGVGDGRHWFQVYFDNPLSEADRAGLVVSPIDNGVPIQRAPFVRDEYEPILFSAMDIVDNCNLRCPFCLYDYSNTRATNFMDDATIDASIRFLPYTAEGNFWFSCLHEPTLHPELMAFITKVPKALQGKIMYTTNLAKRMKPNYFTWLADSSIHHINISIESLDPAIYERMRKGARYRIFRENWDALISTFNSSHQPPALRYIAMAYKSNLKELPELVRYLRMECRADQVELRYTYNEPHIDAEFKREFLEPQEWDWLKEQLAGYSKDEVRLNLPPGLPNQPEPAIPEIESIAVPASRYTADRKLQVRIAWDGRLTIHPALANLEHDSSRDDCLIDTNVREISNVHQFLIETQVQAQLRS